MKRRQPTKRQLLSIVSSDPGRFCSDPRTLLRSAGSTPDSHRARGELELAFQQYLMRKEAGELYKDYGFKPRNPQGYERGCVRVKVASNGLRIRCRTIEDRFVAGRSTQNVVPGVVRPRARVCVRRARPTLLKRWARNCQCSFAQLQGTSRSPHQAAHNSAS